MSAGAPAALLHGNPENQQGAPGYMPSQIMVVDSSGRQARPKLFTDSETLSWTLNATQTGGPENFNQFSMLMSSPLPQQLQGVLTATQTPIPPTWTLQPGNILSAFRQHYLLSASTGQTALNRVTQRLRQQSDDLPASDLKPPLYFGTGLFMKSSVFNLFCKDLNNWSASPMLSPKDAEHQFTPLHVFLLIPDKVKSGLLFNPDGQTRAELRDALLVFKFIMAEASRRSSPVGYVNLPTLFYFEHNLH